MTGSQAQLTIPLYQRELNDFENFHLGRNGELLKQLSGLVSEDRFQGIWLWGEPGRGRSHLLQASCQAMDSVSQQQALYLPLALLPRDPLVLEGLQATLVALDDVDAWLGDHALEVSLMALYQDRLAAGGRLLFAARQSAQQTRFALPDLASRVRALPGYEVLPLDDEGLRAVLSRVARRQGLILSDSVLDFWLHRSVRSLPELLRQLEALDARSLSEQRRVTIPLVKEVLAL